MNYPGWELERQRAALAALLLGGRTAEGVPAEAGGERGAGAEAAGPAWETGGGFDGRRLGGWDGRKRAAGFAAGGQGGAVGTPNSGRRSGRERGFVSSVSAWEALLGVEAAPDVLEWKSWGGKGPAAVETAEPVQEDGALSGGTGARRDGRDGGRRDLERKSAAERRFDPLGEAVFRGAASEGKPGGRTAPAGADGGELSAGEHAAGESLELPGTFRRSGGTAAESLGQDGLTVLYEGEGIGGTAPWGRSRGDGIRAEDGARALSRAVQRDARRYDGGFTIY